MINVRELVVSTESSPAEGLLVAVGDSGPGIASEDRERIFESFYTTKSGGVGIGLSICRSIIECPCGAIVGGRASASRRRFPIRTAERQLNQSSVRRTIS